MRNPADYTVDAMFGHACHGLGRWHPALPPLISSQPEQQTANAGESVLFSITATAIPAPEVILSGGFENDIFTVQIPAESGPTYLVQTNHDLMSTNWQNALVMTGDGVVHPFSTGATNASQFFIRVQIQ